MPEVLSFFALKRLVVFAKATRVYDHRFHPGVNIIRGENGSGKSTIADFIFYVLGGEFDAWKKEAARCTEVRAELLTSSGVLTLRRLVRGKKEPIFIYFGSSESPEAKSVENWQRFPLQRGERQLSFSQALFRACNIPDAPGGDGSNITAHQLMRLLYADQRTPPPRLFRFESFDTREIRIAVGELLLGVNSYELYEKQIELRAARKRYEEAQTLLTAFLRSLPSRHLAVQPDAVERELTALEIERRQLLAQIENIGGFKPDEAEHEHDEERGKAIETLRRQRRDRRTLEQKIEKLDLELGDLHLFIDHLEENLRKITAAASVADMLGALEFTYCPSCLSPLRPSTSPDCCAVCTQKIDPDREGARFLEIQLDTSHQIRESRQLLEAKDLEHAKVASELRQLRGEMRRSRDDYAVRFELAETPRMAKLGELHIRVGQINEQIGQAADRRELAERYQRLAHERDEAEAACARFEAIIAQLTEQGNERKRTALNAISATAGAILADDLPRQVEFFAPERVDLDFGDDAITVDGSMNFAESSNVILKNAALLALLGAATRDDRFWHPRFLLMDNIEDKGMEPIRSHNFQRLIAKEAKRARTPVQVILTTSMPDPELAQSDLVVGPAYSKENSTLDFAGVEPSTEPDRFIYSPASAQRSADAHAEADLHERIAEALHLDPDVLKNHPFHVEEYTSDDDLVYRWLIVWEEDPPLNLKVFRQGMRAWSEIMPIDNDPEEPDDLSL